MMITMNGAREPVCSCGEKAEVSICVNGLKVSCPHCGKEASVHYTDGFYAFNSSDLSYLVAIISDNA